MSVLAPSPTLAAFRQARARQEAAFQRARPLTIILLGLVLYSAFRAHPAPGLSGAPLAVSASVAVVAVGVAGLLGPFRVPVPVRWVLLLVLLGGSAALVWLQPDGPGFYGMLAGVALVARFAAGRRGAVVVVAAAIFIGVANLVASGHKPASWLVLGWLGLAAVYSSVWSARRARRGDDEVERLLVELDRNRDAQVRAAALAERQRLAREMHDVLAHALSGLVVQLEGARLLAAEDPADPRLAAAVAGAHHVARSGLEEARRAIGMLRDDELPGPERLAELAAGFERDSGIRCVFTVTGGRRDLDPATRLALYRVAQEALTNIRKHAHPERAGVRLAYQPAGLRLVVEDFGPADKPEPGEQPGERAGAPMPAGGYGLTGMAERAELLGGTLTAGPADGGFKVELWIPR